MNNLEYSKDQFDQLQSAYKESILNPVRQEAFEDLNRWGVPTLRHEDWKYTRISSLFNKQYQFVIQKSSAFTAEDLNAFRLPGHEQANELVFINGQFSNTLSAIRSASLVVLPLEEAATSGYEETISAHFGHSGQYLKDGMQALSTAFVQDAIFIHVKRGKIAEHPVYVYNITDNHEDNVLAQPRTLVHLAENAQLQLVEASFTLGDQESFSNRVVEVVLEKDARLECYEIQNNNSNANQVNTLHIRHIGKSYSHTVTVSLNGGMVRNNLNVILDAAYSEAHLYGLYLQGGKSHIDNHTVVDNVKPNCYSNELYKGMLNDNSTSVFNGKIFVRQQAQKTNAFQSNRNILLSDAASVNSKPQLEIYADDVKCSHGCTVGQLDEQGLFYLQSRGIPEKIAKSMLLHGFASDVLDKIQIPAIQAYIDKLVSEQLEYDLL